MCTVSFLPAEDGFHLAMNRDEALTRPEAQPPGVGYAADGDGRTMYPREPGGGTWIGINEAGLAFALLNWHGHPLSGAGKKPRSRGEVIPALLSAGNVDEAARLFSKLDLGATGPFRLIVVAVHGRGLQEWRSGGDGSWDAVVLAWRRSHWFSSSYDEREAGRVRADTCAREAWVSPPRAAQWLRALHASHHPRRGAFSVCMHRADARTVSYTELSVDSRQAVMTYIPGPACEPGACHVTTMPLTHADATLPEVARTVGA